MDYADHVYPSNLIDLYASQLIQEETVGQEGLTSLVDMSFPLQTEPQAARGKSRHDEDSPHVSY